MLRMSKTCNFQYRFEGPAIEDGSVDVNQLIPSLLAFKDALFTFNELLDPDKGKVILNVKATKNGRFEVQLRMKRQPLVWVATLFKVNKAFDEFTLVNSLFNSKLNTPLVNFLKKQNSYWLMLNIRNN